MKLSIGLVIGIILVLLIVWIIMTSIRMARSYPGPRNQGMKRDATPARPNPIPSPMKRI